MTEIAYEPSGMVRRGSPQPLALRCNPRRVIGRGLPSWWRPAAVLPRLGSDNGRFGADFRRSAVASRVSSRATAAWPVDGNDGSGAPAWTRLGIITRSAGGSCVDMAAALRAKPQSAGRRTSVGLPYWKTRSVPATRRIAEIFCRGAIDVLAESGMTIAARVRIFPNKRISMPCLCCRREAARPAQQTYR